MKKALIILAACFLGLSWGQSSTEKNDTKNALGDDEGSDSEITKGVSLNPVMPLGNHTDGDPSTRKLFDKPVEDQSKVSASSTFRVACSMVALATFFGFYYI